MPSGSVSEEDNRAVVGGAAEAVKDPNWCFSEVIWGLFANKDSVIESYLTWQMGLLVATPAKYALPRTSDLDELQHVFGDRK
jgi:hypothetical protein